MPLTQPADRSYAVRLLNRALGPKAKVREIGPSLPNEKLGTVIELAGPSGQTKRLRLVPWGKTFPKGKSRGIVWIIREPTPSLRQLLRARGESFVDFSGAVRVELPNLVIDRTDLEPMQPPRPPRRLSDPFADRSSGIARVLLSNRVGRMWGVRELAKEAGIDPARTSRVVRALSDLGLVRFARRGRTASVSVEAPAPLLERWTGVYRWTRNVALAVHAPIGDPHRFIRRLQDILGPKRWALTVQAGAAQVAPHASGERVHVYVGVTSEEELTAIAADAGWPAGSDGKLVLMMPFYRTAVWQGARDANGVPVVSDLQLVLDLWNYPLRGREQAEHILDTLIRPIWNGSSR